jgi:hypothetical protein
MFAHSRLGDKEVTAKFSEQLEQGWSVDGVHKCASMIKGQNTRNDLGTSEL